MKIAIIAMSAKPYHEGHDALIRRAAAQNDKVMVFVSTSDRKRPNELPISGKAMHKIWKAQIERTLPKNVEVVYGGSPVRNVFKVLGAARDAGSHDEFRLYGDPKDVTINFPDDMLAKHYGSLYSNGQIVVVPTPHDQRITTTGTEMRRYLATNDKKSFFERLPSGLDADAVWRELKGTTSETLLRRYIGMLLHNAI